MEIVGFEPTPPLQQRGTLPIELYLPNQVSSLNYGY